MKIFFSIIGFLIYSKLLLFWVWLWQLKEYHWGRFRAHFETQKFKKLVSSFWRIKFPKFTKKVIVILSVNILFGILILFYLYSAQNKEFYLFLSFFLVLSSILFLLVFLLFQIPTLIFQRRILEKARQKREEFKNLLVIGITGSYGKTSTKEFLATVLSEKFNVLKTKKHINAEIGIAQTILNDLKPEHEIFVAEIGAYEIGKIRQVCNMLQPKIGILTGINEQHMSTFGSQENIVKAKFELIEALPEDGTAVLDWDNKLIQKSKCKIQNENVKFKIIKYSAFQREDVWAENIEVEKDSLSFEVFSRDGDSAFFKTKLLGAHNVSNILAAAAFAKELRMNLSEIAKACEKIESGQSGIQLKKGRGGVNIIDATYSANPDGVISHLDYLKLYSGVKIIIMPCLIELGKSSKEVHKRIGERIGQICDLAIITTKDRFKEIKDGSTSSSKGGTEVLFIANPKKTFDKIKSYLKSENVILLESRVSNKLIEFVQKQKDPT